MKLEELIKFAPQEKQKALQKELDELYDRDFKLNCLENGGVDNWQWYSESLEEYWESKKGEEN